MKRPGRIAPSWRVPWFALRPSPSELRGMLDDLSRVFGRQNACCLLGVPTMTFLAWQKGRKLPGSAVRAVWLVHALTLRPDRVQSLFDLATWGRFKVEHKPGNGGDWSI